MKVTWEAADITVGRRYSKPDLNEVWMIGYVPGESADTRFVSISTSDGMVTEMKTRARLADDLTKAGYIPYELLGRD